MTGESGHSGFMNPGTVIAIAIGCGKVFERSSPLLLALDTSACSHSSVLAVSGAQSAYNRRCNLLCLSRGFFTTVDTPTRPLADSVVLLTGVFVGVADCVGLFISQLLYVRVPHLPPAAHVCKQRALTSSTMQGEEGNPNSRLMRLYGPLVRSSSGDSGLSGLAPKGYMVPLLTVGSHG